MARPVRFEWDDHDWSVNHTLMKVPKTFAHEPASCLRGPVSDTPAYGNPGVHAGEDVICGKLGTIPTIISTVS